MMGRRVFQKSCGVVPVHVTAAGEVRFLLLHSGQVRNPKATWEFPKGGVEPGERDEETALRECKEETGLSSVHLVPGYRAIDVYVFHREGSRIKKWVVYFLALVGEPAQMKRAPDGREHVPDAQGRWYQWLSYEETRKTLFHSGQRRVLGSAYAHLTALGVDRRAAEAAARSVAETAPDVVPAASDAGAGRSETGAAAPSFDAAARGLLDG